MKKLKNFISIFTIIMLAVIIGNITMVNADGTIATSDKWNINSAGNLLSSSGYNVFSDNGKTVMRGYYKSFSPKRVPTATATTTKDSGITITRNDSPAYNASTAPAGATQYITGSNSYDIKSFSSGTKTLTNTSVRFDKLYEIGGEDIDAVVQIDKVVTTFNNVYVKVYVNKTNVANPYLGFGCYTDGTATINASLSNSFSKKNSSKNVAYCVVYTTIKLYDQDNQPFTNEKLIFYPSDLDARPGLDFYEIGKLPETSNEYIYLPRSENNIKMDSNGLLSSTYDNSSNEGWDSVNAQKVSLVFANYSGLTNDNASNRGIVSWAHGWYYETAATTYNGSPGQTDVTFLLPLVHVTYLSDEGGDITGVKDEDGNAIAKNNDGGPNDTLADETLHYGDNPSGELDTIRENYCKRTYWTANKTIYLDRKKNNKKTVGAHITDAELLLAKITEDTAFTLHHSKCIDPSKNYASDSNIKKDEPVKVGDIITYEIKYANTETTSQNITITDTLSAGLEYVEKVSGDALKSGTGTTGTITFIDSNVPDYTERTLVYKVRVTSVALTNNIVSNKAKIKVGNNAEISLDELKNPVPEKTYASDTPSGNNGSVVKKDNVIKYSIKYTNPSSESKTVRIVDTLSKGLSYVTSSGKVNNAVVNVSTTTNSAGQTVITMTKSIAANATEEFTYNAKVTGETTLVKNNATIKYNSLPEISLDELKNPVPSKEYASDTPSGKNGSAVASGSTIKYSIKYANALNSAQTVTIKDTISKGLSYVSGSAKMGSTTVTPTITNNSNGTTTLTFTKSVSANASEALVYSVKVNGEETIVKNGATIKYGNNPEVSLNELKNPVPSKSYSPSTTAGLNNTEVKNGDKIKYSIKYANMTSSSSTVTIRDTLSKGLTYVSGSAKVGTTAITPTVSSNSDGTTTLVFTKSVSSGASEELVYEAKVNGAATLVQNGATIKYGNDSEIVLNPLKNAVPTKEYNPDTPSGLNGDVVKKGDTINYVIKYANAYSTNQTVTITDTISKGLQYVSGSAKIGTTSVNPTITTNSDGSTKMVWTKTVTSGTVEELKYSVKATGEKVVVQNSASVKFGSNPLVDLNKLKNPVPTKKYASDTPSGKDGAAVGKGNIIKYSISYANVFTNSETVVITDILSKGISYVSGSAKVGSTAVTPVVTNNSDGTTKLVFTRTIAASTEEALTYNVKVTGGVGLVKNNAKIKYNSTGTEIPLDELKNPVPSKEYASDTPSGKDGAAVAKGGIIKYSIKYGEATGSNQTIVITDTLSKGLEFVSGSAKIGTTVLNPIVVNNTDGTTVLTWTKTLNANAQEELTYSVKATGEATIVNNKAKIKISNNPDINLDELKNTVPSKSYASDTPNGANNRAVKIGEQIKYSIKYANTTGSSQTVVITDKISKGLELVNGSAKVGSTTITPTKTVNSDGTTTLVFTKTVANNAQEELVYNVKVLKGVPIVNNNAKIKYGNNSEIVLNMLKNPVPDKAYASDSASGKNGAEVAEGERIKYSIKYSNVKSGTDAVVITDTLSIGLEYVSGSAKIGNTSVTPTVTRNSDKTTTITLSKSLAGNTTEELTYEALVVGDVSKVENNASIKYNNDPEIALTKLINPLVPSTEIPNVGTKASIIGAIAGLVLVGFGGYTIYKRKHIRRYT